VFDEADECCPLTYNNNNNPIYKAPKALASEALAAGQSWVFMKEVRPRKPTSLLSYSVHCLLSAVSRSCDFITTHAAIA